MKNFEIFQPNSGKDNVKSQNQLWRDIMLVSILVFVTVLQSNNLVFSQYVVLSNLEVDLHSLLF